MTYSWGDWVFVPTSKVIGEVTYVSYGGSVTLVEVDYNHYYTVGEFEPYLDQEGMRRDKHNDKYSI